MRYLDENFNLLNQIDNMTSLIWHEKYYETGVIELETKSYQSNAKYIYNTENKQLGILTKSTIKDNSCKSTGFTLEYLLSNRVISEKKTFVNQSKESICYQLIEEFANDLVDVPTYSTLDTEENTVQAFGENLLIFCQDLLKPEQKTIKVIYDYETNKCKVVIYQGTDLSNIEPLSVNFNNIYKEVISFNNGAYKNYAYVKSEETNQIIVEVDTRNNDDEQKYELFIDGSAITRTSGDTTLTETEYEQALKELGLIELAKYNKEIEITSIPKIDEYNQINLGDVRYYKNSDINLNEKQRVIEVLTGWSEGIVEINAKLGGL